MKKWIVVLMALMMVPIANSSKLSRYMNKMDAQAQAQQQEIQAQQRQEWQQDMNFKDLDFRLDRRYFDDQGQSCRAYVFRARSNPYRHGTYTVCEERWGRRR